MIPVIKTVREVVQVGFGAFALFDVSAFGQNERTAVVEDGGAVFRNDSVAELAKAVCVIKCAARAFKISFAEIRNGSAVGKLNAFQFFVREVKDKFAGVCFDRYEISRFDKAAFNFAKGSVDDGLRRQVAENA